MGEKASQIGRQAERVFVILRAMARARSPITVPVPVRCEPAFHLADAATLMRRAPSMSVPKGAIQVIVPPFVPAAFAPGALARAGLEQLYRDATAAPSAGKAA